MRELNRNKLLLPLRSLVGLNYIYLSYRERPVSYAVRKNSHACHEGAATTRPIKFSGYSFGVHFFFKNDQSKKSGQKPTGDATVDIPNKTNPSTLTYSKFSSIPPACA